MPKIGQQHGVAIFHLAPEVLEDALLDFVGRRILVDEVHRKQLRDFVPLKQRLDIALFDDGSECIVANRGILTLRQRPCEKLVNPRFVPEQAHEANIWSELADMAQNRQRPAEVGFLREEATRNDAVF